MLAVGLWGAAADGRALWIWPTAFVVMVLLGFVAAIFDMHVPFVEPAIACSIVALGLLIALTVRAPVWLGAAIAALFALFHGHAHVTEVATRGVGLIAHATGFSVTTAALHIVGLAGWLAIGRWAGRRPFFRVTGGLIAVSGLVLIVGVP